MALLPFWIFMALLMVGMPVVFALLLGPGFSLWIDGRPDAFFGMMQQRLFNGMKSFPLMAVPFFILAGELMNRGNITLALVEFSKSLIGHVRGGLAQVNILSSILFAGLSGSSMLLSIAWMTRVSFGWRTPIRVGTERRWVSRSVRIEV